MEKKGSPISLFSCTDYRKLWWTKRVVILVSVLALLPVLNDIWEGLTGSAKPKEVMLATVPVLIFRPDQRTSGWGTPVQFPKMMCVDDLSCPVKLNQVKCYNAGLNADRKVKWRCVPEMNLLDGFQYGLHKSSVVCQHGKGDDPLSVVAGSCYLVYSLKTNMIRNIIVSISVIVMLYAGYLGAVHMHGSPPTEKQKSCIIRARTTTSSYQSSPPPTYSSVAKCAGATPTTAEVSSSTIPSTFGDRLGLVMSDPWSELRPEEQRSLMFGRGFLTVLMGMMFFFEFFMLLTLMMKNRNMPFVTNTVIIF